MLYVEILNEVVLGLLIVLLQIFFWGQEIRVSAVRSVLEDRKVLPTDSVSSTLKDIL